jgi:outer membrane protein OmpA-like peptidoglycan-associated protein
MTFKHTVECLTALSLISTPIVLQAHESIAAQYVVPDLRTQWRVYNPNIQRSTNKDLIKYMPGWYVGGGVGSSEASPEGRSDGFYVKDDRDWGYKFFIGLRQFPHWSAEVSYVDTGKAGLGNLNPAIEATIPDATIRYQIPTVSASYHVFGPKRDVDVFGRVGLSSIINTVSDDRIPYEKQTPIQLNVGGGIQWRFAPKWFVRAEYDSFDNDASMVAISLGRYIAKHLPHNNVELPQVLHTPVPPEPVPEAETVCEQFNGAIDAIQFEVDSDRLTADSEAILIETAQELMVFPDIELEIQAHTDSTASEAYNLDLSIRRAETIKLFLQDQGIQAKQLIATGFGESQPRATNDTLEGRALNRRVEFKVLSDKSCSAEPESE